MPRGIMVVEAAPADPTREAEFNEWYSGTHLPEILSVPGFISARRYRATDDPGDVANPYLAVYEIETDGNLADVVAAWRARSAAGQSTRTDALRTNPPPKVTLYELID